MQKHADHDPAEAIKPEARRDEMKSTKNDFLAELKAEGIEN